MKVTKQLRETWAMQRAQFIEEREYDQEGHPRTPTGIAEMDQAIAEMDHLLTLPIGSSLPDRR